jgi:hypothetical protein
VIEGKKATSTIPKNIQKEYPLLKSITLASLCSYIYTTTFMPQDSKAIIPKNGYNGNERSSRKAMLWLKYISESLKIKIRHSKNGGEKYFNNYRVVDTAKKQTRFMNSMVVYIMVI